MLGTESCFIQKNRTNAQRMYLLVMGIALRLELSTRMSRRLGNCVSCCIIMQFDLHRMGVTCHNSLLNLSRYLNLLTYLPTDTHARNSVCRVYSIEVSWYTLLYMYGTDTLLVLSRVLGMMTLALVYQTK